MTYSIRQFSKKHHDTVKAAVVLSGCGVYDGSEITESVATIVSLSRLNCHISFFAPDMNQMHVIDHTTGNEIKQERNVMVESARISRGNIQPLSKLKAKEFNAIFFPGGFGAAKNLSSFATEGAQMKVHDDVVMNFKLLANWFFR